MLGLIKRDMKRLWEPKPLDLSKIRHECRYINHNQGQDICVLIENKKYLEVVIFNEENIDCLYRFIVAPDYLWMDTEEEKFSVLVQNEGVAYSGFHYNSVYEKYSQMYPEWQLRKYMNKPLRLIDHIYSCMHRQPIKEILYKAGLDEIAANIEVIEEYNLIGSSPSDILSELNMRLLKAVNISEGIPLLKEAWKRERLYELQSNYAWMFEKKLNPAMCKYLNSLIENEKTIEIIAKKFGKHYKRLADFWIDSQYSAYVSYLHQEKCVREELKEYITDKDIKNGGEEYVHQLYRYLIGNKEFWNKKFEEANKQRNMEYEYRDNCYVARFPRSIMELILEAKEQRNCLIEYIDYYVENLTDILFLRRCDDEDVSFITLEIYQGEIVQAYMKENELPEKEIQEWIEMYANRIGLSVGNECFDE